MFAILFTIISVIYQWKSISHEDPIEEPLEIRRYSVKRNAFESLSRDTSIALLLSVTTPTKAFFERFINSFCRIFSQDEKYLHSSLSFTLYFTISSIEVNRTEQNELSNQIQLHFQNHCSILNHMNKIHSKLVLCKYQSDTDKINYCAGYQSYVDWNEYYIILPENYQFPFLDIFSDSINFMKNMSYLPNVGMLIYSDANEMISNNENYLDFRKPIFFHRNHLTLMELSLPFGCCTEYVFRCLNAIYEKNIFVFLGGVKKIHSIDFSAGNKSYDCGFLGRKLKEIVQTYIENSKEEARIIEENRVISMTLYGDSSRYVCGALRNAQLAKVYFPKWKLRYYLPGPKSRANFSLPPEPILSVLDRLGVELFEIDNAKFGPMLWRFLVADDTNVDRFLIRDIDDRLKLRDALCVDGWLKSDKAFHCIRDFLSHSKTPLGGGLIGGANGPLRKLFTTKNWENLMENYKALYLKDMDFLKEKVWPVVRYDHIYCCDRFTWYAWPGSHPFPPTIADPEVEDYVGYAYISGCSLEF